MLLILKYLSSNILQATKKNYKFWLQNNKKKIQKKLKKDWSRFAIAIHGGQKNCDVETIVVLFCIIS